MNFSLRRRNKPPCFLLFPRDCSRKKSMNASPLAPNSPTQGIRRVASTKRRSVWCIVYLIPRGSIKQSLDKYYEESIKLCKNKAHDYFPHVTLTSWFPLSTTDVPNAAKALHHIVKEADKNRDPFFPPVVVTDCYPQDGTYVRGLTVCS